MQKKPSRFQRTENNAPFYAVAVIVIVLYSLAFSAIGSCSNTHRAEIAGECK